MKYLLFCILLYCCILQAQYSIPDTELSKTVLFESSSNSSSGFIYTDSTDIFFVTAGHSLFKYKEYFPNQNDDILVDTSAIITYYSEKPNLSEKYQLSINLAKLYKKGYIKLDKENDIAIMKIGSLVFNPNSMIRIEYPLVKFVTTKSKIRMFANFNTEGIEQVVLTRDVFIVGFPKSLGLQKSNSYDFSRPLIRKGIVAGINYDQSTIIIDCASYGGNSGGPVLYIDKNRNIKVIGLITQFLPYEDIWYNPAYKIINREWSNSGYSVVVSMDKILDLIDNFKD